VKLAIVNLKGGSGKTVSSFFLATVLSRRGRTLLVDCDPQGSTLSWSRLAEEDDCSDGESPSFAVMGLPVKDVHRRIRPFESDYEHIVLDTPPGELTIVRSALMAADVALIAVPPTPIDLDRVMPTLELVADVEDMTGLSFRVLLTRVRRISREGRDTREAMAEMGLPLLEADIPALGFYSDSFGAAIEDAGDYELVARELLGEPTEREVSA
jgi:chromosome partitioning protein